jgi:hypothetical protein
MTGTERVDLMARKIQRAGQRLAQLQARDALRRMRLATQARARARRQEARRKYELGEAVLLAGLVDWQAAELVGLLLDGKDRFGTSPTMRLALRKRGAEHVSGHTKTPTPHSH